MERLVALSLSSCDEICRELHGFIGDDCACEFADFEVDICRTDVCGHMCCENVVAFIYLAHYVFSHFVFYVQLPLYLDVTYAFITSGARSAERSSFLHKGQN